MNIRKITSLTMLVSFVLELVTSVILYIVPHGRVAYWSDWRLWGLNKNQWDDLHINLGILFLLAAFLHLYYNWKPMIAYMKNKAKELKIFTADFNIALVLSVIVCLGTFFNIPPMSTVLDFSESIKDAAAQQYGEPPYGHAELSSLKLFAKKTDLDLEAAKTLLNKAGIKGVDDKITLAELAKINQTNPKTLFKIMKPAQIKSDEEISFPDSPPSGFGRRTLAEICATYNLNTPTVIRDLGTRGVTARSEQTFKEIAADNDTDPHALFEVLHGLVVQ